ncbi:MAG: hypothetical protein HYR80_01675 [Nitrospirae bacterium]|nr:hypothetical protein [Nitrospirota bacterium]
MECKNLRGEAGDSLALYRQMKCNEPTSDGTRLLNASRQLLAEMLDVLEEIFNIMRWLAFRGSGQTW